MVEVVEQLHSDGPLCRQINSADARDQFLHAMKVVKPYRASGHIQQ